jgi:glycosyltransferase involved in cell wall biosynthesis
MDILFLCGSFSKTLPTSICLLSVIQKFEEKRHTCRLLSLSGKVYDTLHKNAPINSSELIPMQKKSLLYKLVNYISLYGPNGGIKEELINKYYEYAKKEVSDRIPDVIISSYGSMYALEVGYRLKQNYDEKILYVPYFLDALLSGSSLKYMPSSWYERRCIKSENRLLQNANSIVMMKSAKEKHDKFKKRLSFLSRVTYLDLPLFKPCKTVIKTEKIFFPKGQIVILYVGSMPKRIRDPRCFLNLFCQIDIQNLHLYIAGTSAYMDDLEQYARDCGRIHLLGVITHGKAVELQNEADYLLNIGNSFAGMMPSKVFEYMSTGKPVISTSCLENDPVISYLHDYGNAHVINEKNNIEVEVGRFKEFLKMGIILVQPQVNKESKLYNNTPDAFVSHVESLVLKK